MEQKYFPEIKRIMNYNDIDILEAAVAFLDPEWNHDNVRTPFTRIYLMLDGDGFIEYNGKKISLLPGNICVVPSGLETSFGCDEYLEKIYFHTFIPLPDNRDILYGADTCFEFKNRMNEITGIRKMLEENTYESVFALKTALHKILNDCLLQTKFKKRRIAEYSEYILEVIQCIDIKLTASLSAKDIASELLTSESKLRKCFKKEVGMPIGKYINERLMFKAERELCRSSTSVKEISDMLGFSDQFYFSRCFSAKFGIPPTTYKKRYTTV